MFCYRYQAPKEEEEWEKHEECEKRHQEHREKMFKKLHDVIEKLQDKRTGDTPQYVGINPDRLGISLSLLELLTPEYRENAGKLIQELLYMKEHEDYAKEVGDDDLIRELYYESAQLEERLLERYGDNLVMIAKLVIERELS